MNNERETPATRGQLRRIPIASISEDPRMQVRVKGVDLGTVARYATAIKADPKCMPPITLAQIGSKLVPVDGWHRLHAHRRAGMKFIQADVVVMTHDEALWAAAQANLKNPRPLSKADLLQAFRMYITARRHRTTDSGFKTYREIAADFANVKAHTTIRNWMMRLYPSIARAMRQANGEEEETAAARRRRTDDGARLKAITEACRVAQENIEALGPPKDRPQVLAWIAELARAAGADANWKPGDEAPF
ncbi:MAG: hypothetical protein IT566_05835 [Rhodospirillaceae bacterium]|nr:hypothetical protein [Rhodospirillaceae bacterium]